MRRGNSHWNVVLLERKLDENHIAIVVEVYDWDWDWEVNDVRNGKTITRGTARTKHLAQVGANRAAFKLGLCKTGTGLSK